LVLQLSSWVIFVAKQVQNYQITQLPNYSIQKGIHGQYSNTQQRRTQEIKTRRAQKGESGKTQEAPRLRSWIEKTQSKKDGSRPVEAVRTLGT
jgi:hypothetical protein